MKILRKMKSLQYSPKKELLQELPVATGKMTPTTPKANQPKRLRELPLKKMVQRASMLGLLLPPVKKPPIQRTEKTLSC